MCKDFKKENPSSTSTSSPVTDRSLFSLLQTALDKIQDANRSTLTKDKSEDNDEW